MITQWKMITQNQMEMEIIIIMVKKSKLKLTLNNKKTVFKTLFKSLKQKIKTSKNNNTICQILLQTDLTYKIKMK